MRKLNEIITDILGESFDPNEYNHWDSLQHIEIINAIEKEYDIKFSIAEVIEGQSDYNKLKAIVIKKYD